MIKSDIFYLRPSYVAGVFYFYAGVSLLCLLLTYLIVPEVKGLSLEDVVGVFESMAANKTCVPCLRMAKEASYGVDGDVDIDVDVDYDPKMRHLSQDDYESSRNDTEEVTL